MQARIHIPTKPAPAPQALLGYLALGALLALYPSQLPAREFSASAPEVSATVDRVEAFVGDALSFTVSVTADSTTQVAPLNLDAKLGDFEIQDIQRADPETLKDGRKRYQTSVKLWALETGERQIPPVVVRFTNPGATVDSLLTSAITVTVSSVVGANVDSASIKPLREPLEDPLGLRVGFFHSRLFWGLLVAFVLLVGALVWWMVWRKRKEETEWVDPRSAWEIALDRLAELQNQPYLIQGLFKQYYSELTDILRDYLGSAIQTHTLDMTTAELLSSLEVDSLTIVYKPQVAEVLTQADMVKFARATPAPERPAQDFETVYSLIQSIRDDLAERRRKEEERQRELRAQKRIKESAGNARNTHEEPAAGGSTGSIEQAPDTTPVKEVNDV